MGKPFKGELEKLTGTIKWAEQQDVTALRSFFSINAGTPLICIGSGGSYSAASYAAMLCHQPRPKAAHDYECENTKTIPPRKIY